MCSRHSALWHLGPQVLTHVLFPSHPVGPRAQVYHDLVPVVIVVLGGDRGRVRVALLAGSALPLAMFLAWDAVMLALPPLDGAPAR